MNKMCRQVKKFLFAVFLLSGGVFLTYLLLVTIIYRNDKCSSFRRSKIIIDEEDHLVNIDPRLKLHHFTVLGSHNSYHKRSLFYHYEHPPLSEQLSMGLRQIELDIHLMKSNQLVYHLQFWDDRTTCYCLNDCLVKIARWSMAHPDHFPVYLFIEIKQMFYEDLWTGLTGGVRCEHLREIKKEIQQIFLNDQLILPVEVKGSRACIRSALKKQRLLELSGDFTYQNYGWPPISKSRGKIIPVFIDDVHNIAVKLYSQCNVLDNFFFIAQRNLDVPYASIISVSSPVKDVKVLINSAMNGQISRILLGYVDREIETSYEKVKPYGIHIISSDSFNCTDTPLCRYLSTDFQTSTILCHRSVAPTFCNASPLSS